MDRGAWQVQSMGLSEDLGWLVLSPQEESQPFALQGPYPLEGLLECRAAPLPLSPFSPPDRDRIQFSLGRNIMAPGLRSV